MNFIKRCILFALISTAACAASAANPFYILTKLATFSRNNGAFPYAGLIADGSGNLYGTTANGGTSGYGTVFELAAGTHALNTLVSFNNTNGANPYSGLIIDSSGNLYGTTFNGGGNGGAGTVFEVVAGTHALITLATFDGSTQSPNGGLVADASGNLYGTTSNGGAGGGGGGIVYEVAAGTHTLNTLATFNGTNGSNPDAAMIIDASGNLYGTTVQGGDLTLNNGFGYGTVFKIAAGTHVITTLATFNRLNGGYPEAALISDVNGNLFGTTSLGGGNNGTGKGTVFELAAGTHALSTLATFNDLNGASPYAGLIADGSGNLYGTTSTGGINGGGTAFEVVNDANHSVITLYPFQGQNGEIPHGGLIIDASGNLYGTTTFGGANAEGTVFELSPVPEPSSIVLGLLAVCGLPLLGRMRKRTD